MNLDPFRPYADLIRWGLTLLVAGLLVFGSHKWGAHTWEAKYVAEVAAHAETKGVHAAQTRALADATAAVAAKAKRASETVAREREAIDQKFKEQTREAERRETALRADLRRGAVRLQERWTCDLPGTAAGGAAGHARQADAAGRFGSAAAIVAAGDTDAAVIEWLWESWQADRRALIEAGYAVEAPE